MINETCKRIVRGPPGPKNRKLGMEKEEGGNRLNIIIHSFEQNNKFR